MIISLVKEFLNLVTLAGIIILSRFLSKGWQIGIGVTLVILGLIGVVGK